MKILNLSILTLALFLFACKSEQSTHPSAPTESRPEVKAIEEGLLGPIQIEGETAQTYNIYDRMKHYNVPGISIAVVKDGKIAWAKGYGMANTESGTSVDENTLFQAGSISKPLAALAALKLVQEGKMDLDTDINTYLKGWQVPDNGFTETEKVTLRRLLTHTAGMTVHGFPGYQQKDEFPTIMQVLNGEGNTDKIELDTLPNAFWRYSGGGYTVMEKAVEDVSGMPLEAYMKEHILGPMGLTNSTYDQPLTEKDHAQASAAYDGNGELYEGLWHNYPEQAAAGLWTTPTDLATYCMAIQAIVAGKTDGVLSPETVNQMLTKHENDWGLGPSLEWNGDSLRFQHGGKNAGFTNNMTAFAHKGDAMIVMTNADRGGLLAREIMRAISSYYDWGIMSPRIVEPIELSEEALDQFTGKYRFEEQVNDEDYIVTLILEGKSIIVDDKNNGQRDRMVSTNDSTFIDVSDGDEMIFQMDTETLEFMWNNRFRFIKMEN